MLPLAAVCAVLAQSTPLATPLATAPATAPAIPLATPSVLAPALVFHGRVVVQESGAPIEGARAELRWNRGRAFRSRSHGTPRREVVEPEPFPSATSAADGRFVLAYETKFDPWIVVTAPGRGPVACGLLAGHEDPARALVFDLPRAARLELEMEVDEARSDPWTGFEARVEAPLWATSRPAWAGVTSDDERLHFRPGPQKEGLAFTLEGLPPGVPLAITFTRGGAAAGELGEDVVLAPGETRRISWWPPSAPPARATLRVVVRDLLRAPIAGAPVLLERRADERVVLSGAARALRKLTEADGSATWTDLRAGWHVVGLGADRGVSHFALPTSVRLESGGRVDIELLARAGRRLQGRVFDAWGKAVEGATVSFTGRVAQTPWSVSTRTVEEGRFDLGPVLKEGFGDLRAEHPTIPGLSASVEVKPGEEPDELRFAAPARVYVSVLDADGAPCAAQIRADEPSALGALWRGFAESETLLERRAGPLVVSAYTVDGRAAWASVDARAGESTELELVLETAGQVRLSHRGLPRLLDVTLVGAGDRVLGITTLIAGVDEVVLVPPGSWTVRTEASVSRPIRAEAGVEVLVEL